MIFSSFIFFSPFSNFSGYIIPFGRLKPKMTFLMCLFPLTRNKQACLFLPNSPSDVASAPSVGGYLLVFCFLPLLMMSAQMVTLWYCWKKEKKSKINNTVLLGREWELINVGGAFCFLSLSCRKEEKWENVSISILFVCFSLPH